MDKTIPIGNLSDLLLQLWRHLSRRRQRQFWLLIVLMLISSVAEVLSVGAVVPFLGILIDPERLFRQSLVADISRDLGINSADQLVFPLTLTFALAALLAGAIRIFLLWVNTRLAYATGAELGLEVYRRTLYQSYQAHLSLKSSEVISGITTKINGVTFGVLLQLLVLFSSIGLFAAIVITLIAIDPRTATLVAIGFGASYGLITFLTRRRIHRNSQRIAYEQTQVVKALQEGLGGIRDVLLDGTQATYCNIYSQADQPLRRALGSNTFISQCPRYIMEAVGLLLIALMTYVVSRQDGGIATALPVLGALALGLQRLLPALQNIYTAWSNIAGQHASLAIVIELLSQPLPEEVLQPTPEPLHLQNTISFNHVSYRYACNGPWVLNGINLTISKGSRIGFVGTTGCGKSTTLDLMMGLLVPTRGELLVDGKPVNGKRLKAWQKTIAHVPQNIYLSDCSIAENIAFGVPLKDIDMDRMRHAARQAQIADFIENNPDRYKTFVGERGIRLSGGQRQRIGIARALYKKASVLVFDEATSALDNVTEQTVLDAIDGLSNELTILLVAHRISTVRNCDTIFELEEGRVVAQGTYEQLLKCSSRFRRLAMIEN